MGSGWVAVVAGAVGGLLGFGGAFVTQWWHDRRVCRRARSERLRALYAPLAQAAATLQAVVHEKHHRLIPHGMDEDARSRREQERVRDALALASDQGGWLLIESGADRVSASYRAVAFHAGEYMRLFDSRIVDSGETARLLEEHLEAASKAALALISEAQRQLADLDS